MAGFLDAHSLPSSPLLESLPGILVKYDCHLPGMSHKVRAARWVVARAIEDGRLIPGKTTVIEKTGGNFGFGLLQACAPLGVPVHLAVGLSFSPLKRHYLTALGGELIGIDKLKEGMTPRQVVEWHLEHAEDLERHYCYTDQFNNPACVEAHELETGPEIAEQMRRSWPGVEELVFVTSAGTGAHLTGIARSLRRAGYGVQTLLMEPKGCDSRAGIFVDHPFEGIAVGVSPPLLDWSLVQEVHWVEEAEMRKAQLTFAQKTGFLIGNTSAGCFHVASRCVGRLHKKAKILFLAYDHGLWYHRVQENAM